MSYELLEETALKTECGQQEITSVYDEWAENYEKAFERDGKPDTALVAVTLAELLGDDKNARVLDVAAGTGLVGHELRKRGISNVDGVDASRDMLRIAKENGLYNNTFVRWITPEPTEGFEQGSYDAVIATGCFARKHLPAACLGELLRIVKSGGYVVVGVHSEGVTSTIDEFVCEVEKMVTQKRCVLVQKVHHKVFNFELKPGYVFVLRV